MELLTVNNKTFEVEIVPELKFIKCFDKLIKRDKSSSKEQVKKELAYIRFVCHYKSPYAYEADLNTRKQEVARDLFNGNFNEDEVVRECMAYYTERTATASMKLLVTAREGLFKSDASIRKINEAISIQHECIDNINSNVDSDNVTSYDDAVDRMVKLTQEVIKISSLLTTQLENVNKLEERVKSEMTNLTRNKGGVEKGLFEDPE